MSLKNFEANHAPSTAQKAEIKGMDPPELQGDKRDRVLSEIQRGGLYMGQKVRERLKGRT